MQMGKISSVLFVLILTLSFPFPVHSEDTETGSPIHGTITSLSRGRFNLDTGEEKIQVTVQRNTVIKDKEGRILPLASLANGQMVMISGTRLPNGLLSAGEIMLDEKTSATAGGASGPEDRRP